MTLRTRIDDIRHKPAAQRGFAVLKTLLRRQGRRGRILYAFVLVPTLCISLYLFFIHSCMYVSTTNFALRAGDATDVSVMAANPMLAGTSSTTLDAFVVQSYILSPEMLEKVEAKSAWQAHYGDRGHDIYSRLESEPTREELLDYWQWMVSAHYSLDKGIITVEVKAYTPEMAQTINRTVLEYSEALVNQINARAHEDALRLARQEVVSAEERHFRALEAMQKFRDVKEVLNPQTTAQSLEQVIAGLETQAAAIQAELTATLSVMQANSPKVITLRNKLEAMQEQIAREKSRLAGLDDSPKGPRGKDGADPLSSLFGSYAHLVSEEKFSQELLLKAMDSAEQARVRAISQNRYIVAFQPPTLPDESLYPNPWLFSALSFLFLLVVVGITALIIAAIADHVGV